LNTVNYRYIQFNMIINLFEVQLDLSLKKMSLKILN